MQCCQRDPSINSIFWKYQQLKQQPWPSLLTYKILTKWPDQKLRFNDMIQQVPKLRHFRPEKSPSAPVKGLPNQGHSTNSHSVLFNANMLSFKMHTPKDYTCHPKIREATASKQGSMQVLLDSLWRMNGWKYLIQTSIWSIRFPLQCILVLSYVISIILLHHFDLPFGCTLPSIIVISTWSSQHLQ